VSEAAGPLNVAVDALLQADAPLMALLGGLHIYSGDGPAQDASVADYIELGTDDTAGFDRFNGQFGEAPGLELELWSLIERPDGTTMVGKGRILELAGHVSRILNHRVITLTGYGRFLSERAELLRTMKDPAGLRMRGDMRLSGWATKVSE
jgi:hypothetical protein